jgi:hypothetical protein
MSDGQGLMQSPAFIKGVSSVVIATALDKYFLGVGDLQSNLMFGASVGAGITVGSMIGEQFPSAIADTTYYNGKTIAQRSFELIFGAGTAYGVFTASGRDVYGDVYKRIGVVVATDFISEYVTDYIVGNQLSYLS